MVVVLTQMRLTEAKYIGSVKQSSKSGTRPEVTLNVVAVMSIKTVISTIIVN